MLSDEIIKCREGVVNNPYQGQDKRVVFVCSMGLLRSPTAARMYASKHNTRSAGIWDDALVPLTTSLIAWAHEIVFMHGSVYDNFIQKYGMDAVRAAEHEGTTIKILDVPDKYPHMDSTLQKYIREQYEENDQERVT